jgi:hypothetical protein
MRITRRGFLQAGLGATAGSWASASGLAAAAHLLGAAGRIRVGVVGLGRMGMSRAAALAALAGVEVAALCDIAAEPVARATAELGRRGAPAPRWTADFRALVEDPRLDALVISTPDPWHAEIAAAAGRAGKASFVERPLACDPAGHDQVVAELRRNRLLLLQVASSPFAGAAERWGSFLRAGRIGKVAAVRIRYAPPGAWRPAAAAGEREGLPGGTADLLSAVRAALGLGYPLLAVGWKGGPSGTVSHYAFEFPAEAGRRLPLELAVLASGGELQGAAEVTWRGSAGQLRESVACGAAPAGAAGNRRVPTAEMAGFVAHLRAGARNGCGAPAAEALADLRISTVVSQLAAAALEGGRPLRIDPISGALLR